MSPFPGRDGASRPTWTGTPGHWGPVNHLGSHAGGVGIHVVVTLYLLYGLAQENLAMARILFIASRAATL
jgi:hypothetical protein